MNDDIHIQDTSFQHRELTEYTKEYLTVCGDWVPDAHLSCWAGRASKGGPMYFEPSCMGCILKDFSDRAEQ